MGLQTQGIYDFVSLYKSNGDLYNVIVIILKTLPYSEFVMLIVLVTMIAFYATSFDSIAFTASCYSYRELNEKVQPHKSVQFIWCILLIMLPIALVFSESSMSNLQTVSIVAAFPIGFVMLIIMYSFVKDAEALLDSK